MRTCQAEAAKVQLRIIQNIRDVYGESEAGVSGTINVAAVCLQTAD